jgi:SAM-dependent methyltransferase
VAFSHQLDLELGVPELREALLEYTRQAYALLPPFAAESPRILDIGCGSGTPSLELARLSRGQVIGIDVDEAVLEVMRQRVARAGLGDRVIALKGSICDPEFADASFDLLWEEGALHLLDADRSLPQCRRLLKSGCYLVMHETARWFDSVRDRLAGFGFALRHTHPLPKHCWLTAYAEPLEASLRAFLKSHDVDRLDDVTASALATHRAAIASIRADPDATDGAFFLLQETSG